MDNIFDYLKWRGDLSFDTVPISVEDIAVLAQLSYCHFEDLGQIDYEGRTLQDLNSIIYYQGEPKTKFDWVRDTYRLWKEIPNYPRFANVKLLDVSFKKSEDYNNRNVHLDEKNDEQFAVASFEVGDTVVVAFRGTDLSISGWKESINMGRDELVPGQEDAIEYINSLDKKYKSIIVCGHSKGGNLALYAATYANDKDRIKAVYNFDGPGVRRNTHESKDWNRISDKILSIMPKSSIVGALMGYAAEYKIVNSSALTGVSQHDMFTWVFDGPHFAYTDKTSMLSQLTSDVMHDFIADSTDHEREVLINTISKVLDATEADSTENLASSMFANLGKINQINKNLTEEEKDVFKKLKSKLTEDGLTQIKNVIQNIKL